MSLRHALLTALVERPATGAQLADRFDRSIGYFWSATHQQIYRELATLERAGLVEATAVAATRGRARTYEVRPEGRAELRAWVDGHDDPRPVREPFAVRLRARAALGEGDLRDELERQRRWRAERLALYESIERRDFAATPEDSEEPDDRARLQHLVLRAGIGSEREWLGWLDDVRDVLADLEPHTVPTVPRTPQETR